MGAKIDDALGEARVFHRRHRDQQLAGQEVGRRPASSADLRVLVHDGEFGPAGAAAQALRRGGVTPAAGEARSRAPGKPEGSEEPMTIKVGDQIPSMKLMMGTPEGPKETSTDEVFKGKKVVLFAVPGAFTPTCSVKHLPSFVQNADALKAKGVDTIACIAVNDAFVMAAWAKEQWRRRQDHDAGRRIGGVHQGDRPGARPDRPRHGHAQPALRADRAGRQGDASRRRGAGRLRREQGRSQFWPICSSSAGQKMRADRGGAPCSARITLRAHVFN